MFKAAVVRMNQYDSCCNKGLLFIGSLLVHIFTNHELMLK